MKLLKNLSFWSGVLLLFLTLYLSLATYFRWIDIRFRVGPYFFTHWLSWTGTLFIAFYTLIYYVLKRRRPTLLKTLVAVHMFGNLLSFLFISTHFFQQVSRPPEFYPDLGTGVALYLTTSILVITGFLHRFQLVKGLVPHQNRFLHISVTSAFYIVIIFHILHGVGLLNP